MRLRNAALALVLAAIAAGCGGTSKHAAVVDYINRVDDVEKGMAAPIGQVTQVNQDFARSQTSAGMHAKLAASEKTMRTLRRRLVGVDAPPEASRLRSLLIQLVDREVALTQEVEQLAAFVPPYQAALSPLAAADSTLKKELAASAKGAAETRALDARKASELATYAATVGTVISAIAQLDPPPVWRPAYAAQLDALRRLRSTATALGRAVATNDSTGIPRLLQRFDAAAVADQSVAAQTRQIAAVKAYDARIRRIAALGAKVQAERARLQRTYS